MEAEHKGIHPMEHSGELALKSFWKFMVLNNTSTTYACILCIIWQSPSPGHPSAADEAWYIGRNTYCTVDDFA